MAHCSSPKAAFPALPTRGRPMTSVCTFVKKKKRNALQGSGARSFRRSLYTKMKHFHG